MKILFVHNDYGKFSGEEAAIGAMESVLTSRSHEVTWFRRSSSIIGNSLPLKCKALFSGIYSFESKSAIEELVRENQFDLAQVQNLYPFISPSVLQSLRKLNLPVVMRCPNYRLLCPNGLHLSHGSVCERCLGGKEWNCITQNCENNLFKSTGYAARNAFARITGMIRNNVDVFIVLSEFQKKRFIESGVPEDKLAILPNIAGDVEYRADDPPGDRISYIGRISHEKGINEFVEAARLLPERQFSVAGAIEDSDPIKQNAPGNVTFEGFLGGQELDDFYQSSRIIVFPSICFEGFPNVIAKAMAHRKPVIAARIGVMPEIVDEDKTGMYFEPGDSNDLAKKIALLWDRPDKCREMGEAGLRKARKEYSEEKYYSRLMEIYNYALSRKPKVR